VPTRVQAPQRETWPGELPTPLARSFFNGYEGGTMSDEKIPRVLPRDVPDYHSRQAAHLRALAENATTARLKTRLLKEAERHEAAGEPEEALASS
jgi:hypothetical protein